MRSTFHTLETAKRSLFTQQAAINTVGHNIANANTEGYSRQIVKMAAARPIEAYGMSRSVAAGQLGTGVEFTSIERVRISFLDDQFRNQSKYLGSWSVQSDTLEKLEAVVNEPSDTGIRSVLDKFWNSWSDLSKDPENITGRKIVRENALALTDSFNQVSKQLQDLNADLTSNIEVKATQINTMLSTISSLNNEINRIEGLGDHANDLRDQRDLLTDQLSQIVNIQAAEGAQGYTITMGGQVLVQGVNVAPVTAASLEAAYTSGALNNGEVFGMIVSRDIYVKEYQQQLDTLANTLANGEFEITMPAGSTIPGEAAPLTAPRVITVNGINGLHKLGYTLESPAKAGLDFFTFKNGAAGITASSIQVNPEIVSDSNKIATSARVENGETVKGNNTLALLMAELRDVKFKFDETAIGGSISSATISDNYNAMVGSLGVQAQEAKRQATNSKAQVDLVNSNRESVSGVSLDEEMSELIRFQHAYSAAARIMTTFDQMLEKLINGTGVVGR
ncbi:flagellar hook-associated protein FlgK [Paenibacillus sambharensis]|uniref:Flagellar hook-associated protein 1 n=1 Tax=Paenibacillus sambharensis TaxID=1803190 RepID=A0A2W1LTH8_9BACL|nr:flagellar hook-associated protein FlgK [Paenibacillus sambharensis]PZD97834.1 flagellar hook-associated protein FlgK [Paenibacillus sambharensis]